MSPSATKNPARKSRGRSKADTADNTKDKSKKMPDAAAAPSSPIPSPPDPNPEPPSTKGKKATRNANRRKNAASSANEKSPLTENPAVESAQKRLEAFNTANAENGFTPPNADGNASTKKKDKAGDSEGPAYKSSQHASLPASLSDLAPADKLLWEERNNGRGFDELVNEYATHSGQKTTAAALSGRFWAMKRKYVYWTKSDTDEMLAVLSAMQRAFESEKWSMVSEQLRRSNKVCFNPHQIKSRFESLAQSGDLPADFLPSSKDKTKRSRTDDDAERDTHDKNVESFILGELPIRAPKRQRGEFTAYVPVGYECVPHDDEDDELDDMEMEDAHGDDNWSESWAWDGSGEGHARDKTRAPVSVDAGTLVPGADAARRVVLVDDDVAGIGL